MANGLEFYNACYCAGTGCGGHVQIKQTFINWTPAWNTAGAAQHTYTRSCDGLHGPGVCPEPAAVPDFYRQEALEWGGCTDPGQFDVRP